MNAFFPAIDKQRLAGLQDGVYGFAMTLLVLELKLPALSSALSDAALWSALGSLWPKLLTWLLSFCVLALFWIGDVRTASSLRIVDASLLRVSLARLALVSLLPFSTAVIGEYGDHVAGAALYAGHLCLFSGTQVIRHRYLIARPALSTGRGAGAFKASGRAAQTALACTAAAFGLAFVVPGYNMLALLPLLVAPGLRRATIRRQRDNAS
ncbi:MAG TPA: TMEM175 family protein [Nevskiaceae bacterium]